MKRHDGYQPVCGITNPKNPPRGKSAINGIIRPMPKSSHGYGLALWLPGEFLDVEETLALGELDLWAYETRCSCCGEPPDWRGLEKAHIVRRGLGGKKKGKSGPTVLLRVSCHEYLDAHDDVALAIRKDGAVCWLELGDETLTARAGETLYPMGAMGVVRARELLRVDDWGKRWRQ